MSARNVRLAVLLVALGLTALQWVRVRRAESWVPSWELAESVTVVLLHPSGLAREEKDELEQIQRFVRLDDEKATFRALQKWLLREHGRFSSRKGFVPVQLSLAGPFEASSPPPVPPLAGETLSFSERWRRTRDFLGWYEAVRVARAIRTPNVVYVWFYRAAQAQEYSAIHSVCDRRSRSGFVYAPLTAHGAHAALINVAHELFHVFGATDKYDGSRCVYPQGFAEPLKKPRYPQRWAEVMAQGIPLENGAREGSLDRFEDMRVGVATAAEIGWIDGGRRDRYYGGDASAGPRED